MKLFNAFAAAAVIGTSFIATPAEARNGWVYVASSDKGAFYAKPDRRSGQYVHLSVKDSVD